MKDDLKQLMFAFDYALIEPGHADEATKALKNFAANIKKVNKEIRVSAISFNEGDEIKIVNQPIEKVKLPKFGTGNTSTGACSMLDKTSKMMDDIGVRLTNTPEEERPSRIILTIVVFGRDNASKNCTYERIREMIALQRDVYNWKFFLMTDFSINMEKLGIADEDTIMIKHVKGDWFRQPFEELSEKIVKILQE
ncbi:MAG: hypothetical protein IJT87_03325 [Ruminiclostridium sp.]|nr:hypothetical protein [Ruminiclostridium sp.]